jgi:hypothetical protein
VDQDFGKAVDPRRVDPQELSGKPQLHISKMRVMDSYEARRGGKVIKGGRML